MDAAPLWVTGDPKRVNQTCTEGVLRIRGVTHGGQNPGGKIRATDSELGHAVTHGGREAKSDSGRRIRATDSELGHAVTRFNNIEDPKTQALCREFCLTLCTAVLCAVGLASTCALAFLLDARNHFLKKFILKVLLKCVLTPFCVRVDLGADLSGRLRGRPRTP